MLYVALWGFLVAVVLFFFSFQYIVIAYEIDHNLFLFSILIRIDIWGLFLFEGYCNKCYFEHFHIFF